jgi:hypothetical protein
MKKVEFAIIERFALGILIGFSYLPEDEHTNFTELNIYVVFIVLHFKFYNNANT